MNSKEEVVTASVSVLLLMAGIRMLAEQTPAKVFGSTLGVAEGKNECFQWTFERNVCFRWHNRMVIHRGVHRVNVYQT